MKIKKLIYIAIGIIALGLGAVGAVLPILPSVPFLLLSAFCFGKSSKKLDLWFKGTKLYKKNLESFVKGQGMTVKTKVKIMTTVTILMTIGFISMKNFATGQIVLAIVWLLHILYFCFGTKTIFEKSK